MNRSLSFALAAIIALAIALPSVGQIAVWKDDDPITAGVSGTSGGLIVEQIADPTGDPDRELVGDVSTIVTNNFSNMRPDPSAPQPVLTEYIGKTFTFTLDYFIPSNSSMQQNLDQAFFLSLTFRDVDDVTVEQFQAGFIGFDTAMKAGELDCWKTIEITGTVPAGSDEVVPLMVFNNGTTPLGGTATYVDNVNFSINGLTIEESPIWVDDDPITMDVSDTSGGLIVTQVNDPTGDPDRIIVGEVDNGASTQTFTNMRPAPAAPQVLDPNLIGEPFSFTLDYFIPTASTMQQDLGQRFFLSLNFRDENQNSIEQLNNGFIGYDTGSPLDTWGTLTITGTIPEGAFDAVPLMVFNNSDTTPTGVAIYVDNVNFSAQLLVESEGCEFPLGDVNQDGVVNLLDVGPFVEALSGGPAVCEADVNEDGVVNLLDVGPFVEILSGGG